MYIMKFSIVTEECCDLPQSFVCADFTDVTDFILTGARICANEICYTYKRNNEQAYSLCDVVKIQK